VIVDEPVGVKAVVLTVSVLEKVGVPDSGLKPHEAPEGKPDVQDRLTDAAVPLTKVAVIVFEPELP
jgi:hypothetical protein